LLLEAPLGKRGKVFLKPSSTREGGEMCWLRGGGKRKDLQAKKGKKGDLF